MGFGLQKEGSNDTAVKKQVLQRDQVCQYRDKLSGRICGSQWNLHADRIQPRWAKGANKKENLQILCQKQPSQVSARDRGAVCKLD
ncbi:MAG: hypothetical protein A4S09_13095 [Proteobacteria bacterium SG_bin7]|nr:MAG: hypothetical protein A4S09_13095 [Proteobacteria bacterium SG_bin7]